MSDSSDAPTQPELPSDPPGLGIDLVDVARFRASLERGGERFRDRVFTRSEQEECARRADPGLHLAARFAVKEAAMKALGTGWGQGVRFCDFELESDGKSAPRLALHGRAAELAADHGWKRLRVSLSHTDGTAGAVVMAEAGP